MGKQRVKAIEDEQFGYRVNIGDGDLLVVKAHNLTELEKIIDEHGEFDHTMINSVVREVK